MIYNFQNCLMKTSRLIKQFSMNMNIIHKEYSIQLAVTKEIPHTGDTDSLDVCG